jgi:hypothetical protein
MIGFSARNGPSSVGEVPDEASSHRASGSLCISRTISHDGAAESSAEGLHRKFSHTASGEPLWVAAGECSALQSFAQ